MGTCGVPFKSCHHVIVPSSISYTTNHPSFRSLPSGPHHHRQKPSSGLFNTNGEQSNLLPQRLQLLLSTLLGLLRNTRVANSSLQTPRDIARVLLALVGGLGVRRGLVVGLVCVFEDLLGVLLCGVGLLYDYSVSVGNWLREKVAAKGKTEEIE